MASVTIQTRHGKQKKTYAVRYRDPITGKNRHYGTYKRKMDAQRAKQELEYLIDHGRVLEIDLKKNKWQPLTFADIGKECEKIWLKKAGAKQLSQKTVDDYLANLKAVNREFGETLALKITKEQIDDYRYDLAATLSNASANRRLFIIKQVFQRAVEMKAVPENPTAKMGYFSEKHHERNRFLQPDEIVKLVKNAQKTRGKYYLPAIILLGADTGSAIQELLDLSWKNVDFKRMTIRFYRTKNKMERTMPILERDAEALKAWWAHLEEARRRKRITDFKVDKVFCHLNGEGIKEIRNSWKKACKLANIHDFRIHDLRHTYCTNLLESGASLAEVMELIGHNDIRMTKRYTHVSGARKKTLQGRLQDHYNRV